MAITLNRNLKRRLAVFIGSVLLLLLIGSVKSERKPQETFSDELAALELIAEIPERDWSDWQKNSHSNPEWLLQNCVE